MAGRMIMSRAAALGVAVSMGLGAGAAVAAGPGFRGSPAAVSVARNVLAHVRHVPAIHWRQSGDQWACPTPDGPIVGPSVKRPAPNCRRAIVTVDENLRNGRVVRSVATTTARGMATSTELTTGAGDWVRTGRARCWDAEGAGAVGLPAFSYTAEKLTIVARTSSVISLHGVGTGFRETDAIDAHTFAIDEITEHIAAFGGTATLVGTFADMGRPFALPKRPRHVCSDIVRFPSQRRPGPNHRR
jgi:hypothetical protein